MKKVLLGVVFCAMGTFAFGQKALPQVEGQKGYIAAPILKKDVLKRTALNKKDNVAGWYGYIDATSKLEVIEYTFYNNVSLFPDSTVKQIWGDGAGGQVLGPVTLHAVGQAFDPKSAYFADDELGTMPLSKYNKYRWDSVAMFYTNYQHHVPGSVDTLIFQFYTTKNSGIRLAEFNNESAGTTLVGYNPVTNLGTGAAGVYKYLLDEKDTATDRFSVISVPVMNGAVEGIDVPANGLAGFTVSYRPGYSYSLGDTLDSRWTSPAPTKKLNHFRVLVGQDQAKNEHESYNHGMRLNTPTRYDQAKLSNGDPNGWRKLYIPGDAWNAHNEHLYSTFYISASGVSVEENGPFKGYGVGSIYPNPASGIANLTFELGKTENVTIDIYNVVGQKMSNVSNGTFAAGKHNVNFSVENLNAGVYFYTINAGGYSKTMKFTVVK